MGSLVSLGVEEDRDGEHLAIARIEQRAKHAALPADSKHHPITTRLGQIQRQVYATDSLLSMILGPSFHLAGRGPVRELTGHCETEPLVILPGEHPIMGFTLNAPVTGVWQAGDMIGVVICCDKGLSFWLPLLTTDVEEMPSIYVSLAGTNTFRNLDLFGPKDIDVLSTHLFLQLEAWLKTLHA